MSDVRLGASRMSRFGSLGSGVIEIEQQGGTNLLLNIEIANLHIAESVIRIHRITVGDAGGGGGNPLSSVEFSGESV